MNTLSVASKKNAPARGLLRSGAWLVALVLALATAGCVRYDVTLKNQMRPAYSSVRRPVLDEKTQIYTITTATGRQFQVPKNRVSIIEPHMSDSERKKEGMFSR